MSNKAAKKPPKCDLKEYQQNPSDTVHSNSDAYFPGLHFLVHEFTVLVTITSARNYADDRKYHPYPNSFTKEDLALGNTLLYIALLIKY
jgi:hypothetical protein